MISIDQSQGITTDPASFTVTAENLVSPHTVTTPLTVTFEGESAVSYAVTTRISGAKVSDWIITDKLSDYITISFGGQSGNLSVTDSTLSITGLTNSPGGDAGTITFGNLPAGFTAEPTSITLPNPDGTETATITPDPNTFTITEDGNTGNSGSYTIAAIELAKLTRFTPSLHIKVAEGGTDITSGLTITEEAGNTIRIVGLTNKLGANQYTLTIEQVAEFFRTPNGAAITRTIADPTTDISSGTGAITPFPTFELTNSGESTPTTYTLVVDFSAAAVGDWFTASTFRTYIGGATYGGINININDFSLTGTTLAITSSLTNLPGRTLTVMTNADTLPSGFTLSGLDNLTAPEGAGAVTDYNVGAFTIREDDNTANTQTYNVTITLVAYESPVAAAHITAMFGSITASEDNIAVSSNVITIQGFENIAGNTGTGSVTFNPPANTYTVDPMSLSFNDPEGTSRSTITNTITINLNNLAVVHEVRIVFYSENIDLIVTSANIMNDPGMTMKTISSGGTLSVTNRCEVLAEPTLTVDGNEVTTTPLLAGYYDRLTHTTNSDSRYEVSQALRIVSSADQSVIISDNFAIEVEFEPCEVADLGGASKTGNDAATAYEISRAEHLELVSYLVNESNSTYGSSYYTLTAAIDLEITNAPWSMAAHRADNTRMGFTPIGTTRMPSGDSSTVNYGTRFRGNFNCGGHVISNLFISNIADNPAPNDGRFEGLFGIVDAGNRTISNCGIVNVNITGHTAIGGLVGNLTSGNIIKSYVSGGLLSSDAGQVAGQVGGQVGGLAGVVDGGSVSDSYATSLEVEGSGDRLGGLVGFLGGGTISTSYATVTITRAVNFVGGLVGEQTGGMISDSYARTSILAGVVRVGGLVGLAAGNGVTNSYAAGIINAPNATPSTTGGFIGQKAGDNIVNSYYDTTATTVSSSAGGTGRTTAQMQVSAPVTTVPGMGETDNRVYDSWDTSIWDFTAGQYPRLKTVVCANRQYNQAATDCTSTLQ